MKPLAGKLVEVTATIINEKVIPTHADVDVKNKITPPDVVSISGRGLKVVAADGRRDFAEMEQFKRAMEAIGVAPERVHRAFDRYFAETMPGD